MLYQITAEIDGPDGEYYVSRVVEAPAHRRGVIPAALETWVRETFLTQWAGGTVRSWGIAAYWPTRIGYRDANAFGVSDGGMTSTLVTS